ncbi:hypothetical protein ABT084_18360 [Streptomyces sp. NPDC002138]|uniref:hypothetical protein n=1 Tax=Streptomyces sp. NPDC002138 TaxID=3154410 RepID=UPI003322EADF
MDTESGAYARSWLPQAVAKGSSSRWTYGSAAVLRDADDHLRWGRAQVIAPAQAACRYARWRRPRVVAPPGTPRARRVGSASAGVRPACRARLLRHTFAVVTLEQLRRGHLAALA